MPPARWNSPQLARLMQLALLLTAFTAAGGCHRAYYRQQADHEVAHLVHQKASDPRWQLENFSIYPDHR